MAKYIGITTLEMERMPAYHVNRYIAAMQAENAARGREQAAIDRAASLNAMQGRFG